ncbi:MAG TPA: preprotein translocase subunit YajC [Dyella sp.]|uniref:preprotein translocase subunit YajC n=1 Tax=Dyella sp. TaxID=1869338 RepID=UPI002F9470E1
MSLPMSFLLAQAAAPAAGAQAQSPTGLLSFPVLMILMFGVMYFIMIRPQMKRQKEHRAMLTALSKGDEVVTNGGIAGRVDEVGETFVTVEIASNVKVKVQKGAVSQVLPKGALKAD